jgi:DNA polymerase III alpha subunit
VWAGPPLDDVKDKWKNDAKVNALVAKLAARRTPLDEAEKDIKDFLGAAASDKVTAGKLLFAGLFDTLNVQRSSVMSGLERVMRRQREAADKVRDDTLALQALQSATAPDQTKIDELSNQLLWETRIFEDRRRVVKYVCEVPTAIDQRLFALGRAIQQEIE